MMCCTFSISTANCTVDNALRSECTITLATLRWTKTSPGSRPVIWLAGTRLSDQPIHMNLGFCCWVRLEKKPGRSRSICAAQARLWVKRSLIEAMGILCGTSASHRFGEQLSPDEHAPDLAGAGADLVQLGVAPQPPDRVVVDVAVAPQDLDAFAGHPGGLLRAPQDHGGAVLAHLPHVLAAELVQVLAHRVAEGARRLQHRVHVGDLALDQLELADALAELLAVVDVRDHAVHHGLHDPDRPGRQYGTLVVEAAHENLGPAVEGAENVIRRHFDVPEHELAGVAAAHAQLVQLLRDGETLHALLDQE